MTSHPTRAGRGSAPTPHDAAREAGVTPQPTTVRVPLSDVGHQALRATADDGWTVEPLPLQIVDRDSTPGRTA